MNSNKKKIRIMLIVSIIISLITVEMVIWRMEYAKDILMLMKNSFTFAIEFGAILVLTIAMGGIAFERVECDTRSYRFATYLFAIVRALFYDFCVWMSDGVDYSVPRFLNFTFNSFYFLAILSMMFAFTNYLMAVVPSNIAFLKRYLTILKVCHYFVSLILIFNIKFKFIFSIENGYYKRGFVANILFSLIGLLLLMLLHLLFNKSIDRLNKIAVFSFIVLPFICTFLQIVFNGIAFVLVGVFVSACILYVQTHMVQSQKIQEQQIEIERQKSAIMLSQIQPHFLYNTLTTISFLCRSNPQSAEKLTNRFSNYLRSNIVFLSTTEKIDFKTEIDNVDNYLEIEKVRFEDRVNVKYNITVDDFKIPMLTVQPIVENAVKHGICKKEDGGTIEISTYEDAYNYYIDVNDDGIGFDMNNYKKDGRIHVGIDNVRKRMESIGGEVIVESQVGVGTKVNIRIPKES